VFHAVRGAVGQQHGTGRGGGVHDADHRLLGHAPLAGPCEREDERAHERREETGRVRLPGVELVAEENAAVGASAAIWASAMSTKTTSRAST